MFQFDRVFRPIRVWNYRCSKHCNMLRFTRIRLRLISTRMFETLVSGVRERRSVLVFRFPRFKLRVFGPRERPKLSVCVCFFFVRPPPCHGFFAIVFDDSLGERRIARRKCHELLARETLGSPLSPASNIRIDYKRSLILVNIIAMCHIFRWDTNVWWSPRLVDGIVWQNWQECRIIAGFRRKIKFRLS